MKKLSLGWAFAAMFLLAAMFLSYQEYRCLSQLTRIKREAIQRGFATLQYDLHGEVFFQWEDNEN